MLIKHNLKPTIYIPIEIKARELNSQIFLAYHAALSGFRIYIGSKSSINNIIKNKTKKGGIYFYKGGSELEQVNIIDRKCDAHVVLDQEVGPVIKDYESLIPSRFYPGTLSKIDRIYTIGPLATDAALKTLKGLRGEVVMTGWPRVDLMHRDYQKIYEIKIREIKNKFDSFLLFSSDFGVTSHDKIDQAKKQALATNIPLRTDPLAIQESAKRMNKNYNEFKLFLSLLKTYDEDPLIPKIIVRPHPAEDHIAWQEALKGFKKTLCIYEGEITPWLYASDGILHRGCTTAIHAYIANIPSAFIVSNEYYNEKGLVFELSFKIKNINDFYFWLEGLRNRDNIELFENKKNYSKMLNDRVFFGGKPATVNIVEDLQRIKVNPEMSHKKNIIMKFTLVSLFKKFLSFKKTKENIVLNELGVAPPSQKIPGGITKKEVRQFLKSLDAKNIKVCEVDKNCIEIDMG